MTITVDQRHQLRFPFQAAPVAQDHATPWPQSTAIVCDHPAKVSRCNRLLAGLDAKHRDKVLPASRLFDYAKATSQAEKTKPSSEP